jgi:cyanate permease
MTANQLGLVAAPPLFGLILDITNTNYRPAWAVVGIVLLLTATRVMADRHRYPAAKDEAAGAVGLSS